MATIVGLTESTTYHFIVIPANSLGAGTPSLASQSASTLVSSLPGIAYFEEGLTVIGNDRVTVHWRLIDTGGITCTFDVELVDSVDWSNSQNGTDVSGNTVTFTGLIASRTYDLYITARNVEGYGARSDPITFVASSPTLPGDLSTQVAIMNSTSESVFVEWNPVVFTGGRPITGYKLEMEEIVETFSQLIQVKTDAYVTNPLRVTSEECECYSCGGSSIASGARSCGVAIPGTCSSTVGSATDGCYFNVAAGTPVAECDCQNGKFPAWLPQNLTFRVKQSSSVSGTLSETACMSFNVTAEDLQVELRRVFLDQFDVSLLYPYSEGSLTNVWKVTANNFSRVGGDSKCIVISRGLNGLVLCFFLIFSCSRTVTDDTIQFVLFCGVNSSSLRFFHVPFSCKTLVLLMRSLSK